MRWLWIDKFTEFTSKQSATAVKNVSLAEEHLHDLYPAFPIVPHSLIVEGMAQTAGILVGEARNFAEKVILAKLGDESFEIRRGDRIAQLVPAPVQRAAFAEVASLDETARGAGGFGSTGVASDAAEPVEDEAEPAGVASLSAMPLRRAGE